MISGTRYRLTAEINRQSNLAREIARAQVEIATGKRIQTPSDDPTGSALVAQLSRTQGEEAAWIRNLEVAGTLSDRADNALTAVAANVDRASELMVAAASGTLSPENRATIALELRAIASDVAALANSRDPRGGELFHTAGALEIPVSAGNAIAPVGSRAEVFGNIATAGGPIDLVTLINNAADAIVEPVASTRTAADDASLAALGVATNHVAAARADQGVRATRIERLREQFEQSAIQIDEQKGAIEGADLTEAIARLQSKQLSLQAAQAVLARVSQSSLFDMLR